MNDLLDLVVVLVVAADEAAAAPAAPPRAGLLALWRAFLFTPPHFALLTGLLGFALLVLMLAPERHRAAVTRLARPLPAFALGGLVLAALGAGLIALGRAGVAPGRGLLVTAFAVAAAAGLSVSARALGERVLPERGALAQTLAGLAALLPTCCTLLGLPVLLVAVPLGLGGWLLGRRAA